MPIRAVFYDLDGTLRTSRPAGRQIFADYAATQGLHTTPEIRQQTARWEHYYWASSPELRADGQEYPDEKHFWVNYCHRQLVKLGATQERAQELALQFSSFMQESYHPVDVLVDGLAETLAGLRVRGVLLGVISNRQHPFGEYLRELAIDHYFDFYLAAGEINSWKPDKEIFLHALRLTGMTADETIYVGDNYYADVLGARNAGLNPVLIDPDGLYEAPDCLVIQEHSQIFSLL